jgi:ubiquinone/menaquinone biosynthesis C-methylase UbiE
VGTRTKKEENMKIIKEAKRFKFKNDDGILSSSIDDSTTLAVSKFYSEAPFPNYQGYENPFVLSEIVTENYFLNDLKNHIRFNKRFIEVGSGTCQLSLAMAIGGNSHIVAMDPTKESLKLGKEFAEKNNINNVVFLNSDIFDDEVQDAFFDVVWCSGVLHHTKDSKKGFEIIAKWAKKDGLIIVGVYNKIGRLRTNFRQVIYKLLRKSDFAKKFISFLDPYLRKNLSEEKKLAWFRDQYEHPVERKHSIDEVMHWFEENDISFLGSIPSTNFEFKNISEMNGDKGTYASRFFSQLTMLFSNLGGEGGLCIVVGKKI